jgi:tRNA modification GTPase
MIYSPHEEAIVAQCTPIGSGAIALLRLSGINAYKIADKCTKLASKQLISTRTSHTVHYGWIVNEKGIHLDQVLFLVMHGPQTFTGQDIVEITCHNNPFIIDSIIQQLIRCGARIANRGEFTQRAYLNKKIDLVQAEAINELIHAHTQQALKKSLAQLEGSFSEWICNIEKKLLRALMLCEASFEFNEDDINFDDEIRTFIHSLLKDIQKIEQSYDQQQQIRDGIRIALIGSVNAGKSSLFNALIEKNRAIVTNIPGTTRDAIEAGMYTDSSYITLVDTAGLRNTDDHIEQEGIKRSFEEAKKADIIILTIDSSNSPNAQEEIIYEKLISQYSEKIIPVATKSDIKQYNPTRKNLKFISTSTKAGKNIDLLKKEIQKKITKILQTSEMPFLLNNRHFHTLQKLKKDLQEIKSMTTKEIEPELISIHLKDALERLTELSGKNISEQALDEVFKQFCVGK